MPVVSGKVIPASWRVYASKGESACQPKVSTWSAAGHVYKL